MALPDYIRRATASEITCRSSGGSFALSLASVANNAARQGAKVDFGFVQEYAVILEAELAATPTAGNPIELYIGPSNSATVGTDNPAGLSGTDAAYTGQSSNLADSVKQLQYIGDAIVSALATSTVQRIYVGRFAPIARYGCPVVYNKAGSAFHTSDANCVLRFIPIDTSIEDT